MNNPFLTKGYVSSDLFCDREAETEEILSRIANGVDTTLFSPRKYGKTGLILHVFDEIKRRNLPYETVYVDVYSTLSVNGFVKAMAEAILEKFPPKTSVGERFMQLLRSVRPTISYDSVTGEPGVEFGFTSPVQREHTLKTLFSFLNCQDSTIVLAIDEFQQITEYEENNVEAMLRTLTQQMHNVRFIYCGSKRHTLAQMFTDTNRPFFSSTRSLTLDKIDADVYGCFIRRLFARDGREVTDDALAYILEWSRRHTFYTQSLCNELYAMGHSQVDYDLVLHAAHNIIDRESSNFLQIRNLITPQQWRIMIAVAKEQEVSQVTSASFLSKYGIGSATNCRRAIDSLTDKELLLEHITPTTRSYQVYNVFLSRWLETL